MRQIVLIFLFLAFSGTSFVHAQEKGKDLPLKYTIKLSRVDQKERSVSIELAVKNVSDRIIIMDKKAVRYKLTFVKHGKVQGDGGVGPSLGRVFSGHPSSDVDQRDFLSLSPNGTFRGTETLHFSSSNDDFFENGHSYSVSLTYGFFYREQVDGIDVWRGVVESNDLCFKLSENAIISLKEACEVT